MSTPHDSTHPTIPPRGSSMRVYEAARRYGIVVLPEHEHLKLDTGEPMRDTVLYGVDHAILVDINNVVAFEHAGHAPKLRDMQGVISPWPYAWYEFTSHDGVDLAMLVTTGEVEGERVQEIETALNDHRKYDADGAILRIPDGGFLHTGHLLMPIDPVERAPFLAAWAYWFADTAGDPVLASDGRFRLFAQVTKPTVNEIVMYTTRVVTLACALANCRNVALVEEGGMFASRQERRYAERTGAPPPTKFYTLRIGPLSGTSVTGRTGSAQHRMLPLHIVRGHFARYSEERPLFGKYAGTFWIPAHVRGREEAGRIDKSYRVEAEPSVTTDL